MKCRQLEGRSIGKNHSADICIARHRFARIYLYPTPIADYHHATARCEDREISSEIQMSRHLQDNIQASARGCLHDLREIIGRTMIEDLVRPLFAHQGASTFRARGPEHAHSSGPRQLHSRRSNSATRSEEHTSEL